MRGIAMFGPGVDRNMGFCEQCDAGHALPITEMMQLHIEDRRARRSR
jgi:hypothetical protein